MEIAGWISCSMCHYDIEKDSFACASCNKFVCDDCYNESNWIEQECEPPTRGPFVCDLCVNDTLFD